jgi:Asp-tRNA(Asn)/Glu-tRNA(Gln) amidotransferase A subunit family amidase
MNVHNKALSSLSASEAAQRIREESITSVELVEACIEQISRLDSTLGAWETVNSQEALESARLADKEAKNKISAKPLQGVPVGIKDIFNTAGLATKRGSPIYQDHVPTEDATCISLLRAAGAIILGKTVTTEFATTDPALTLNPWDSACTPGGSSTGSAVAVATQMCPVALGSQTSGSTLRPASYNGIVGLKPSYGRISRWGVFPVAWTLDTIGILSRSVEDAALFLQVMANHDPRDIFSSHEPVPDYTTEMIQQASHSPRIGFARGLFWDLATPEVRTHTLEVLKELERSGATIQEINLPDHFPSSLDAQATIMATEAAAVHHETFAARPEDYGPLISGLLTTGALKSGVEYLQAQQYRPRLRREVLERFEGLDALLTPTTPSTAPRDLASTGDRTFQSPWTFLGLPTIALPTGISQSGLPLSVQIIGKMFEEGTLLGIARWCEQALDVTVSPPLIG